MTLWIIHRQPQQRNALARLAGAGEGTLLGGPDDPVFEGAEAPDVIVLALAGDFETELSFVERQSSASPRTRWLLLADPGDLEEAERLFDTLAVRCLSFPPDPTTLRRTLRDLSRPAQVDSLSTRRGRDILRDRFGRWFENVELPELARAIDPHLDSVPVLVRGEPGTGRGLVARYVHAFGGRGHEPFIHVGCTGIQRRTEFIEQIAALGDEAADRAVVWLEDVDRLPTTLQREVRDWIEFGPPTGWLRARRIRWLAGAGDEADLDADPGLDPRLAEALSGLTLRLPSLREDAGHIDRFVNETTAAWCGERGETPRRFGDGALQLLNSYPWLGNRHELEAVIIRTLSFTSADPLQPAHLRFPGDSSWIDPLATSPQRFRSADPEPLASPANFENDDSEFRDPFAEENVPLPIPDSENEEDDLDALRLAMDAADIGLSAPGPEESENIAPAELSRDGEESDLRRMIRAVAHDVRNPLVSIRTFSEMLSENYDDPEFRDHFRELVSRDVARIDGAISRLQGLVDQQSVESVPVDLAHLLDKLLDEHSDRIRERRLLVLKELDYGRPQAFGDPMLLRDAFSGLLNRAFEQIRERGDLYLASKHHDAGHGDEPSLRVLIRYACENPAANAASEDLEGILAQTLVQSLGGTFTSDTTAAEERVIVIDLPAPGPE